MNRRLLRYGLAGLVLLAAWQLWLHRPVSPEPWSADDRALLASLSLSTLGPPPPDPGNRVADDPDAALLGQQLFFDTRLSGNNAVSCATCHQPDRLFTDGLARGRGIGESGRNTRSIVGAAWSPWQYWDGRRDSLWSQALSPLEDPAEHGSDRESVVQLILGDPAYRQSYSRVFGSPPPASEDPGEVDVDRVFSNAGKAIAAFERTLRPERSRFDDYADAIAAGADESHALSRDEVLGLQLFIGKARCVECHNGPLLTNNEFHNTGVIAAGGRLPDRGRVDGLRELLADPFNCLGEFSDDPDRRCAELEFARSGPELLGAVRTPGLRGVSHTAPYMHSGQLPTLDAVVAHYDAAPDAMIGHNEAEPLGLSAPERRRLVAFLESLGGP